MSHRQPLSTAAEKYRREIYAIALVEYIRRQSAVNADVHDLALKIANKAADEFAFGIDLKPIPEDPAHADRPEG